jgi:hypothetical protein|tara:strand:- start:1104 stop:1766 length:663 start_codon:yes stop_codon:yes gene_type:complete
MLDRSTFGRCAELGLPAGMSSYVQGRLGVMGDISADEAADAAFFFDRGLITNGWEADCDLSRSEGGAAYAQVCVELGRTYLDGFDGAERMADLLATVLDAADMAGLALATGWRDAARPPDATGRAYLLTQATRELRLCRHVLAARAGGGDPMGMVLAVDGERFTAMHGYQDVAAGPQDEATLNAIGAVTDQANATDFEVLTADERTELVTLAEAAVVHTA